MNTVIILFGAAQAFFLVILLLTKKQKKLADYILSTWLFLLGVHLAIFYKNEIGDVNQIVWYLNAGISLIQGPFLYLYSKSLIKKKLSLIELLHFIPFTSYLTTYFLFENVWTKYFEEAVILSQMSYLGVNFYVLKSFRKSLMVSYSNIERSSLKWLQKLTLGLFLVLIFVILTFLIPGWGDNASGHNPIFLIIGVFVLVIGYFGLSQGPLLVPLYPQSKKYASSSLKEHNKLEIMNSLDELMKAKNLYLQEDLNLTTLAKILEITENDLSQSFGHAHTNFYDYINRYRVQHAKNLITDGQHDHLSLLGIAYESGFQSKATFNRAFKKHTNLTPSVFKKNSSAM